MHSIKKVLDIIWNQLELDSDKIHTSTLNRRKCGGFPKMAIFLK